MPSINFYLTDSVPLLVLAALGVIRATATRRWSALYLAGWAVAGYLFLVFNRPTWPHHQLLVTVPSALLAAIAAGEAVNEIKPRTRSSPWRPRLALTLASLVVVLVVLAVRIPPVLREFNSAWPNLVYPPSKEVQAREAQERQIVALMSDHRAETNWVYTDRPMFAFAAGLSVPPYLAVLSSKRVLTGQLTEDEILATLETYKPELILATRFDLPVVREYMNPRNFRRLDSTLRYRLYFRPRLP